MTIAAAIAALPPMPKQPGPFAKLDAISQVAWDRYHLLRGRAVDARFSLLLSAVQALHEAIDSGAVLRDELALDKAHAALREIAGHLQKEGDGNG